MQAIEVTAKTVQEAVDKALAELGVAKEDAVVEILEEPSRGFLGLIGARPARVRVSVMETPPRFCRLLVDKILKAMGVVADIETREDKDGLWVIMNGENLGILIGRRGETLDALQYIVNLAVNKKFGQRIRVILDVEGYRKKREETLRKLALKLAEKVKQRGRSIVLEPMTSMERKIIHTTLQGRDDITTFSEGEEPFRKIIIAPKRTGRNFNSHNRSEQKAQPVL